MSRDLDLELEEYRDIKDWLAGRKRPAQGRTWRRKVQVQIQKVLPKPMRSAAFTLAPVCGATLLRLAVPLLFVNTAPQFADIVIGNLGPTAAIGGAVLPMVDVARSVMTEMRMLGSIALLFSMLLVGVSWVVAGE
jgi:hypothetical protein